MAPSVRGPIGPRRGRRGDPGWAGIDVFFPSFFPPPACITCGAAPHIPWFVADPCLRTGDCWLEEARLRFPGFDRLGSDLTDAGGLIAKADSWTLASDLLGEPASDHPVLIALSSDGSRTQGALVRDAKGFLTDARNALAGMTPIATGGAATAPAFSSFAAAYRAADMGVLVLGTPKSSSFVPAQLWRLDLVSGLFSQLPARLPEGAGQLGTVYAVGTRHSDPHLYALVEIVGEAVGLVRLRLDGSDGEVLDYVADPGAAAYPRHALLFDSMGDLLLVGYGPDGYTAVHAPMASLGKPDAIMQDVSSVLAAPVYDRSGVSFPVSDPTLLAAASGFHEGEMERGGQYHLSDAF